MMDHELFKQCKKCCISIGCTKVWDGFCFACAHGMVNPRLKTKKKKKQSFLGVISGRRTEKKNRSRSK